MWISPKPMVDGFVKIFGEFRNGCDEKSATVLRQYPQPWQKRLDPGLYIK